MNKMKKLCLLVVICTLNYIGGANVIKSERRLADTKAKEGERNVKSKFLIDKFVEALKNKIPDDIFLPDQIYNGHLLWLLSTQLELNDAHLLGVKGNLEYEIGYKDDVIPISYRVTMNTRFVSNYLTGIAIRFLPFISLGSQGCFTADIANLTISGQLAHQLLPPSLELKTMNLYVEDIMVQIDKILGSEGLGKLFGYILSSQATAHVNEFQEIISVRMMYEVNQLLRQYFPNVSDDLSNLNIPEENFGEIATSFLSALNDLGDTLEPFLNQMP